MKKGFSLVELLLVLGLIGLLAAMAYPNYTQVLVRTRRLEAQTALLNLAGRLEQEDHPRALNQTPSLTRWYRLSIQKTNNKHYLLTATPIDSQTRDAQCQSLTLTSEGLEGIAEGPKGYPTGPVKQCWS